MKKLAIITSHPIQYNAPWIKLLSQRGVVAVKVFYTWSQTEQGPKYDPTFQRTIEWDIPLLEGYDYEFVKNVSKQPGSHHFKGIDNPTLNKSIEEWKADAVLVIGWSYKSHLSCMRHFKGRVPVFFRGDSTLLDETAGFKTLLRRLFLRWVYSYVDNALYVGTQNKAYFKAHGLKERQLTPASHAIDNGRFTTLTSQQMEGLRQLQIQASIAETDFVVLFAGKLEEKKNPLFLLSLAKELTDPCFSFVLAGNGPLEAEVKAKASHDKRIKFLPFQNQSFMPALYRLGHVFILPSKGPGETWGLAANEAMACGLPVIMSAKCGGAIDLIKENGLVFHEGDVKSVARYIKELKNSPDAYKKAAASSLSGIEDFSFAGIIKAIETAVG